MKCISSHCLAYPNVFYVYVCVNVSTLFPVSWPVIAIRSPVNVDVVQAVYPEDAVGNNTAALRVAHYGAHLLADEARACLWTVLTQRSLILLSFHLSMGCVVQHLVLQCAALLLYMATAHRAQITILQGYLMEVMLTFVLVFVVLRTAVDSDGMVRGGQGMTLSSHTML